jgi:hypothetical protein
MGERSVARNVLHNEGRAVRGRIAVTNIPVKTRLPFKAWFFAGLVTFLSMVSSLLHFIASGGIAHVEQASMAYLVRF